MGFHTAARGDMNANFLNHGNPDEGFCAMSIDSQNINETTLRFYHKTTVLPLTLS